MVRRSQLAQGCAAVRFALGHGKSIERTLFITIPITRRDHRSERKLRARMEGRRRRGSFLRCEKKLENRHFGLSRIRAR